MWDEVYDMSTDKMAIDMSTNKMATDRSTNKMGTDMMYVDMISILTASAHLTFRHRASSI